MIVTIQWNRNPGEFPAWKCFSRVRPRPGAGCAAGRPPPHERKVFSGRERL